MQESFEESHKQQLEELRITLQKEHETKQSDVIAQHQMEMKSLREVLETEQREKFEVSWSPFFSTCQYSTLYPFKCSFRHFSFEV